jgi:hypothetical protein
LGNDELIASPEVAASGAPCTATTCSHLLCSGEVVRVGCRATERSFSLRRLRRYKWDGKPGFGWRIR